MYPRREVARREPRDTGAWSPFQQFNRLRNEIDRLFGSFTGESTPAAPDFFEQWAPSVDMYDDKDKITVCAELPGMKKEDIDISLTGNTLSISGERKHEDTSGKKGENYRSERYFGRFHRSMTLPHAVDANRINATYKDGVLNITLPKTEEARRKQIEVKVS
jgi:HSP20 family protein